MDAQSVIDLQNQIVISAAEGIKNDWDAAVVNIEIEEYGGELAKNCLAVSFTKKNGSWIDNSFELPHSCYELFVALRGAFSDETPWTVCTLEFNSEGENEFSFGYDAPKRINGIYDDEAMLTNYRPPSKLSVKQRKRPNSVSRTIKKLVRSLLRTVSKR